MIKTRKPIQSTEHVNFLAPKSAKTFAQKVKEWIANRRKK